jgi:hypothetical protein
MAGREVALLLASALVGVITFKVMEHLSASRVVKMREPATDEKKSEDGSESESESDDDLPAPGTIKDDYTLMSGKFKMVLRCPLVADSTLRFCASI